MRFFILFIFFFFTQTYTYSTNVETEHVIKKNNDKREVLDSAFFRVVYRVEMQALKEGDHFIITDTMALDVGQRWSVYYDLFRQYKDSVDSYNFLNNSPRQLFKVRSSREELDKRLESRQEIYAMRDARKTGESARIYRNRTKNEVMTIDKGPMEFPDIYTRFRFTEQIEPQDWVITEDTLHVLNYACQKATTSFRGRDYTAWFTLDIPVSEGPWKLHGLPGLILKVEDSEKTFCFQAIGLQDMRNTPIVVDRVIKFFHRGRHGSKTLKFIGGDSKQWQTFRQQELKKVTVEFLDWDALTSFSMENPVVYPEIEIEK